MKARSARLIMLTRFVGIVILAISPHPVLAEEKHSIWDSRQTSNGKTLKELLDEKRRVATEEHVRKMEELYGSTNVPNLRDIPLAFLSDEGGKYAAGKFDMHSGWFFKWNKIAVGRSELEELGLMSAYSLIDPACPGLRISSFRDSLRSVALGDEQVGLGYYDRVTKTFLRWRNVAVHRTQLPWLEAVRRKGAPVADPTGQNVTVIDYDPPVTYLLNDEGEYVPGYFDRRVGQSRVFIWRDVSLPASELPESATRESRLITDADKIAKLRRIFIDAPEHMMKQPERWKQVPLMEN